MWTWILGDALMCFVDGSEEAARWPGAGWVVVVIRSRPLSLTASPFKPRRDLPCWPRWPLAAGPYWGKLMKRAQARRAWNVAWSTGSRDCCPRGVFFYLLSRISSQTASHPGQPLFFARPPHLFCFFNCLPHSFCRLRLSQWRSR